MKSKKPDATHAGVTGAKDQAPDTEENLKDALNARKDLMSGIAAKHAAHRNEMLGVKPDDGEDPELETDLDKDDENDHDTEDQNEEVSASDDDDTVEPETDSDEAESSEPEPPEQMVTIKVDGQNRQVPLAQIREAGIRTLQKESAADRRLEEATRLQQQAQEMLARASEKSLLPSPSEASDAKELEAATQRVSTAIYSGDEDEVRLALQELVTLTTASKGQAPTLDKESIASMVRESVSQEEYRRELLQAQRKFADDFPEIDSDPDLRELANLRTIAILRDNPDWTPGQVITKAGEEVRNKLRIKSSGTTDLLAKRRQAKRSNPAPTAASSRAQGAPEAAPKTRADIVAEMQKRRAI